MYIEAECPKTNSWYLCEEKFSNKMSDKPDCVQQMITHQQFGLCKLTPVTLKIEALEQLDEKHYTISFPEPTKVKTSCIQEKYQTLYGSYLATIPQSCLLKTPEFTISNIDDRIKGHALKMSQPSLGNLDTLQEKSLRLNTIRLENLHEINEKISLQSPVKLKATSDVSVYHTTIPLYLILFGASALGIIILYRRLRSVRNIEAGIQKINPSEVKIDPSKVSATISAEAWK